MIGGHLKAVLNQINQMQYISIYVIVLQTEESHLLIVIDNLIFTLNKGADMMETWQRQAQAVGSC